MKKSAVDDMLTRWLAGEDVDIDDDLWSEIEEYYSDVQTYVKECNDG